MVTSPVVRPGHSLAELIVALALLGTMLAALTASALLATGWTTSSVLRQQASSMASTVLDSLVALPVEPVAGGLQAGQPAWLIEWDVVPDPVVAGDPAPGQAAGYSRAVGLRVTSRPLGFDVALAELEGLWIAPLLPVRYLGDPTGEGP